MDPSQLVLEAGTLLGAYRAIKPIGRGGMGVVWLAEHVLIGRRAAIKILRTSCSQNEELVTRFFNEARAAAAISDPGIVQIFDFGYHTDGSAYLVMELLDGEPLDKRLDRTGVLPVAEALRTMRQVASSLGAAHARNIVHRDLKPDNLFIVRDPEVPGGERAKILDFGIAKLADDPGAKKTETLALIGTPMFMSPEQCRGSGAIDARTDIYSLGCVLFTLLVGAPPFDAAGVGELIAKHIYETAPRASSLARGIPPAVDALIARCLAKDPAERFANGSELAAALGVVIGQVESSGLSPVAASALEISTETSVHPTARLEKKPAGTTLSASAMALANLPPTRRSAVVAVMAIGVVTVCAGGAYLALRPAPEREATSATAAAPIASVPTPVERADQRPANADRQLAAMLAAFTQWAAQHPTEPCPTGRELAAFAHLELADPWGHDLVVTCTSQPADQIVGASSAGPDGIADSDDDRVSWRLDPGVLDSVRGPRWAPARVAVKQPHANAPRHAAADSAAVPVEPAPVARPAPAPAPIPSRRDPTAPSFHGTPLGSDGIPTSR